MGSDGKRLAIIAHSGVGKTSLLRQLREDPRLTGKLVVDLDSVMPAWFDRARADALDRETSADYWLWAKMSATQAAIRQKADIVTGLFAEGKLRDLLEAKGYSLVALSVPESTHRDRLERQLEQRGRKGIEDVQKSLSGQKRLEGLGYELIDADRPVAQVADDVVKRVMA